MSNVLILTTVHGYLTSSRKNHNGMVDVSKISRFLEQESHHVIVHAFEDVHEYNQYQGWFVLYASSEDTGLFYKSYIEDVILVLEQAGAILLPKYEWLRAHHNKSYMEMRRTLFQDHQFQTVKSRIFASYEGIMQSKLLSECSYPMVVKSSAGAGAQGVILVRSKTKLKSAVKKVAPAYFLKRSWSSFCQSRLMFHARKMRRWMKGNFQKTMNTEEKFVVQTFIAGLKNDYKVLIFANKYYILERKNRKNDFRASGSGIFIFPTDLTEIQIILDFARKFYQSIETPICSLDIGVVENKCHLLEFQCLNFGPYTLEFSSCWFEFTDNEWIKKDGESVLEQEYAGAIVQYIRNYKGTM